MEQRTERHGSRAQSGLTRRDTVKLMAGAAALTAAGGAAEPPPSPSAGEGATPTAQPPTTHRKRRIDAHLHLWSGTWVDGSRVFPVPQKTYRNRAVERFSGYNDVAELLRRDPERAREYARVMAPETLEEQDAQLVSEMDAAGITTAFLQGMDWDHTGETTKIPYRAQVEEMAKLHRLHPGRFLLFLSLDLRRGRTEKGRRGALELVEWAVKELGYVGIGELLTHFGWQANDRELCYPYYEKSVEPRSCSRATGRCFGTGTTSGSGSRRHHRRGREDRGPLHRGGARHAVLGEPAGLRRSRSVANPGSRRGGRRAPGRGARDGSAERVPFSGA